MQLESAKVQEADPGNGHQEKSAPVARRAL